MFLLDDHGDGMSNTWVEAQGPVSAGAVVTARSKEKGARVNMYHPMWLLYARLLATPSGAVAVRSNHRQWGAKCHICNQASTEINPKQRAATSQVQPPNPTHRATLSPYFSALAPPTSME